MLERGYLQRMLVGCAVNPLIPASAQRVAEHTPGQTPAEKSALNPTGPRPF